MNEIDIIIMNATDNDLFPYAVIIVAVLANCFMRFALRCLSGLSPIGDEKTMNVNEALALVEDCYIDIDDAGVPCLYVFGQGIALDRHSIDAAENIINALECFKNKIEPKE